jgi:hypothetical protein
MPPLNVDLDQLVDQIESDLPGADPVTKVGEARNRARQLGDLGDRLIDHYVQEARNAGASWSQIGDAMGVSKQAAQQRTGPNARFARFTDRARHVLITAQDVVKEFKQPTVGTEHILLGLLAETDALAAKVIVLLGGSLDALTEATRSALTPGEEAPTGHIPFNGECKQVLEQTTVAALDLGHNFIGTEHILLGLLRVPESRAAQLLRDAGIDHDRAREAIKAALVGFQHRGKR